MSHRRRARARQRVTLEVEIHPWIKRQLAGVARRQRMSLDAVVLAAVCEMATRGDDHWREYHARAHAGRIAAGLAVPVPQGERTYLFSV